MNEHTISVLDAQLRRLYREASDHDEAAHDFECQAIGLRKRSQRAREAARGIEDILASFRRAESQVEAPSGFLAACGTDPALAQREVQHVDTDEPEAEGIPPHVWLYRNMLTELQAVAPLGRDETNGQYAVAIDELTDEQRAIPHVSRQLPGDVLTVAVDAGLKIEENDIVRRATVPYAHVWLKTSALPHRLRGAALEQMVQDRDKIAVPWISLTDEERRGFVPAPSTSL